MFGFNATTVVASLPLLVKLFGADSADVVSPSPSFSSSPSFTSTFSATESCEIECKTDYDCPSVCVRDDSYSPFGTCVGGGMFSPSPSVIPTKPTDSESPTITPCECNESQRRFIPSWCEVDILIDIMETHVLAVHSLLPQWTRAAFHDAGTFNQMTGEGGANGCLLNHAPMRLEPENGFMHLPLITLMDIKNEWERHACIKISSADILQFAASFATTRQSSTNGFGPESFFDHTPSSFAKRDALKKFMWGRPDEGNCDTMWADNLPSNPPSTTGGIPARCTAAGIEIREKMMKRNGFTAEESTVLIGAHSIGLIRNTFGPGLAGPWVVSGKDNATPMGPVFDNSYHDFLINTVVANDVNSFAMNVAPFDDPSGIFPSWFRDHSDDLDHLDTDLALAFPPLTSAHPDYSVFSTSFANDNDMFLKKFFLALDKMSKLGVLVELQRVTPCGDPCGGTIETDEGETPTEGWPQWPSDAQPPSAGKRLDIIGILTKLGNATAFADETLSRVQEKRADELIKLTTPIIKVKPPTPRPSPSIIVKTEFPTQPVMTRPPIDINKTLMPTQPVMTKPPIDIIKTMMPTQPVMTKPPIDINKTLMPTQPVMTKPPIDGVKTLMPTQPVMTKPPINGIKTLMPTQPVMTKPPIDTNRTLMPTQPVMTKPPIDGIKTLMPTQPVMKTLMPTQSMTKPPINNNKTLMPTQPLLTKPPIVNQPSVSSRPTTVTKASEKPSNQTFVTA